MATTCVCGAVVPASAVWCSLCHRVASHPQFTPTFADDATLVGRDQGRAARVAQQVRERRAASATVGKFASTEVTFGMRGRLGLTVLMLLPLWFFLQNFVTGGWVGIVIWGTIGMPWALRDIWRRSDRL